MLGTALLQAEAMISETTKEKGSGHHSEKLRGSQKLSQVPNMVMKQELSPDFWRKIRNIGYAE